MHVGKKTKFQLLGITVVIIGIMIVIIPIFLNINKTNKENSKVEDYIEKTAIINEPIKKENNTEQENKINVNNDENYLLILEIPKISLKRGVYSFDSKLNTIEKNVQIMKESILPNVECGNLVLEAHNGTASLSYFKELYKLKNGDIANIYFNGTKYTYMVSDIYDVSKDGIVEVYRDENKTTLTLITCKRNTNDRQLVIVFYLEKKENY